jgi:hypothetical protein
VSDVAVQDAQALRETLHRWPRERLGRALEIAAGVPEPQARHELMLRVILRLHGDERSRALARLISSLSWHDTPEGRVSIFMELMKQGWKREAFSVAVPLLEELEGMPSPDGYALCWLIPWLDTSSLDRAAEIAARVAFENVRAECLAALLDRSDLPDRAGVARALRGLMPLWDIPPARRTAVMESMAGSLAREEVAAFLPLVAAMPEGQDSVLGLLAPKLDAAVEDAAIDLALELPDVRQRRGTLRDIAAYAPAGRARKLLARLLAGEVEGREETLRTIVASLPLFAVADLVDWAHSEPGGAALEALVATLARVPSVSLAETLSLIRAVPARGVRGHALIEYAVHAAPRAGLGRGALLVEASETLKAEPVVVSFFRRWGDRLTVISVEEVQGMLHEPARLVRLVWPNLIELSGDAAGLLPLLLEVAPPAELTELVPALARLASVHERA